MYIGNVRAISSQSSSSCLMDRSRTISCVKVLCVNVYLYNMYDIVLWVTEVYAFFAYL